MYVRTDPSPGLEHLVAHLLREPGGPAQPAAVPVDAYRDGDTLVLHADLPGVGSGSIHLEAQRDVLTIRVDRPPRVPHAQMLVNERPHGLLARRLSLGDAVDVEAAQAEYHHGVLTVRMPVREGAGRRRVRVSGGRRGDRDPGEVARDGGDATAAARSQGAARRSSGGDMRANIGDVVVVPGRTVGTAERRGRIVEVRGPDGGPPYLVRWEPGGNQGLFFPAPGARLEQAAPQD